MGTPFCSRYASLNVTPFLPSLAPAIQLTNLRPRNGVVSSRMESTSISISGDSSTTTVRATAAGGDTTTTGNNSTEENSITDTVVQYVVLRRDLIDTWPLGSVVTQGCHAAVAAIWSHKDDAVTLQYCSPSNLDSMHKVTLEVKGEAQILNLAEKLKAGGIAHKLWIEQPENIPTCLATKPCPKSLLILLIIGPNFSCLACLSSSNLLVVVMSLCIFYCGFSILLLRFHSAVLLMLLIISPNCACLAYLSISCNGFGQSTKLLKNGFVEECCT